jgi:hypothetical protein
MPCRQNDGLVDRSDEWWGLEDWVVSRNPEDCQSYRLNVYRLSRDLLKFLVSSTHLLNRMTPELIAIHELERSAFYLRSRGGEGPEHDIECGM